MRASWGLVIGLTTFPGWAAGATLPGASPTSAVFAGTSLIVSQTGPVTSGLLRYDRTDVWRVALKRGGSAGRAERLITVRTSAGRLQPPLLSARPDGTFALVAHGPRAAPAVIWCCDAATGIQEVVESDGRPGSRVPLAIWVGDRRVRYITVQGADARLVEAPATQIGAPVGLTLPSIPRSDRIALSETAMWWVENPAYGSAREVVEGRDVDGEVRIVRRLPQPGTVHALLADGGQLTVLVHRANGDEVRRGTGARLWRGRHRPLIAAGGGRVAVAEGRMIRIGTDKLSVPIASRETVRALAVDRGRVAWAGFVGHGVRRRTAIHWVAR